MHIIWASHIKDEEEKEEFKKYVENSSTLLDRLTDIIKEKMKAAERQRVSEKNYQFPAWPYKMADYNGYIRALTEIKAITNRKENHA